MPQMTHATRATVRRFFRTPRPILTPMMIGALGLGGAARAQEVPETAELLRRIEALEASNRALAGEVDTLRAGGEDAWLTERRADEIRAIVTDVLADSSSRTSLQSAGMTAGWNDGFYLESPDQRFRLEIGGLVQTRYTYSSIPDGTSGVNIQNSPIADNVENRSGFDLPGTILEMKGHAFGQQNQFKIKAAYANTNEAQVGAAPFGNNGSASGSLRLLDAYMRIELSDDWSLRVGQFKLPFGREFLVDREYQLAVARSVVSNHLSVGRSQGLELTFVSDDYRAMLAYSGGGTDNVYGILKGAGSDPVNAPYFSDAVNWAVTGRGEWKVAGEWGQFRTMTSPPGDEYALLFGLGIHAQEGDPNLGTSPNFGGPNTWFAVTADMSAMYGGASLFASFTWSYMDSESAYVLGSNNFFAPTTFDIGDNTAWGAVIQGSYSFVPKWEVFARFEIGDADLPDIANITTPAGTDSLANGNLLSILTLGVNWYIDGEDLKWQADVGLAFDALDGVWWDGANGWRAAAEHNEVVFRTQLQMAF